MHDFRRTPTISREILLAPREKKSKGSATLLCRLHCPTYPCMRRDSVKRLVVVLSEFLHFAFLEKEIYVHLILLSEEKINQIFLNERCVFQEFKRSPYSYARRSYKNHSTGRNEMFLINILLQGQIHRLRGNFTYDYSPKLCFQLCKLIKRKYM